MSEHGCKPTSPEELERQIMDSNVPKNEREWWARDEIERLREHQTECKQHGVDALRRAHEREQRAVEQARLVERQAIEQRLRQPDGAMLVAVMRAMYPVATHGSFIDSERIKCGTTALADALFPASKEGE